MIAESIETQARRVFDAKLRTLRQCVQYRCMISKIRHPEDVEDVQQLAAMRLWHYCHRSVAEGFEVDCGIVALNACAKWLSANDRHRGLNRLDDEDRPDPVAPATSITIDGVTVTGTDARMDHPDLCDLYEHGETQRQTAKRLKVSRQYVAQIADRLGGHRFDEWGGWRFPVGCERLG